MKITRCMKVAMSLVMVGAMSNSAMAFDIKSKDGESKLKIFGLAQLEARGGKGAIGKDKDASIKFGAQRIRIGWKYKNGNVHSKLFVDFMKIGAGTNNINANGIIKDAVMGYKFNNAADIKLGIMKMPVGMGFTTSGADLDVVERGFDKKLVLERNAGLMVSGRGIWGGFGYDVMFANQASRSAAVTSTDDKGANSYALRMMYNVGNMLHTEVAYGVSPKAVDGKTGEDYSVLSVGLDIHRGPGNAKLEYMKGSNIKGVKGSDESTWAITAGYYVLPNIELMAKHIAGTSMKEGAKDGSAAATYLGVNLFLGANANTLNKKTKRAMQNQKLQLNYVLSSKDKNWTGLGGKGDDYFVAVYQIAF